MKQAKEIRPIRGGDDSIKKPMKLEPIKKSGKERHQIYGDLDDEEMELDSYRKRESVLDYYDDQEE